MKTVLIIEDDPITAHIYKTRLEKEGYQVEVSADGQSGFYRLHEEPPDAVLLDMMLPKMNGLEILRKIRAQSKFQAMPILVFTNAYVPNMINDATRAGATHVFNKATVTPRQLLDTLRNVLSGVPMPPHPIVAASPATPVPPVSREAAVGTNSHSADSPAGRPQKADLAVEAPFNDRPKEPSTPSLPPPAVIRSLPSTPAPPLPVPPPGTDQELRTEEEDLDADLLQQFLNSAPSMMNLLRKLHVEFSKATEDAQRQKNLTKLYCQVHAVTGSAGLAGLYDLSQMASSLEALLKELQEKPTNINASTLRTVAHAIDFLGNLLRHDTQSDLLMSPTQALVVDDEMLSRRAITVALDKAQIKSVSIDNAQEALKVATETSFDLIFLDVQMPEIDGFALCTQIRSMEANRQTPIIFVTSLTDFASRARSSLSGGTDFIAKPFLFIELTVKSLIHILQSRMTKS